MVKTKKEKKEKSAFIGSHAKCSFCEHICNFICNINVFPNSSHDVDINKSFRFKCVCVYVCSSLFSSFSVADVSNAIQTAKDVTNTNEIFIQWMAFLRVQQWMQGTGFSLKVVISVCVNLSVYLSVCLLFCWITTWHNHGTRGRHLMRTKEKVMWGTKKSDKVHVGRKLGWMNGLQAGSDITTWHLPNVGK